MFCANKVAGEIIYFVTSISERERERAADFVRLLHNLFVRNNLQQPVFPQIYLACSKSPFRSLIIVIFLLNIFFVLLLIG